ncbi:XRCC4-like factor-domain-containing protein [Aspergillus pseudoustus]|uniref:Non-homologous end-joining factor 1 n=1 Tax=Aspergillus pseudoustus TaxID=1810923 RepID=A0ABR4J2B3_9EURO
MTIMTVKWQRLRLSNQGDAPPLLFKFSYNTATGYELYMTDLNYMWSERLDRKAILKRADDEDTTIDPSEDSEQFNVLLQKIGEGLQNTSESSSVLTPQKLPVGTRTPSTTPGVEYFQLTVASELPAPLRPLVWRLQLSRDPQSSTTNHLLLPLIRAEGDREARQQSLIEELNKKDWILAKLFDKIEAMEIDLSTIFPGTSGLKSAGRKGPTLAQAAKYIRGLAPFDEEIWLKEVSKSSTDSGLAANIITAILGNQGSGQAVSLQPPRDGWWDDLTDKPTIIPTPHNGNKKSRETEPPVDAGDEEFERQETPPRLKKPAETATNADQEDTDEETQSEDEDIHLQKRGKGKQTTLEHRKPPATHPKVAPVGKAKGLGTIGGKKQAKTETKPAVNDDDDKTTDGEPQTSPTRPPVKKNDPPKAAPKVSRGLGVIGGKKKKNEPTPAAESEPKLQLEPEQGSQSPEPSAQTQSEPKKKKPLGKLGVIGGAKAKGKPAPSAETRESVSPEPSRKVEGEYEESKEGLRQAKKETPAPEEPRREETEQERADRKRQELKRQLEAKSKAPVKKKRRF